MMPYLENEQNLYNLEYIVKSTITLIKDEYGPFCGGVLIFNQRILASDSCIPKTYKDIKVQLQSNAPSFTIKSITRKGYIVIIHVSICSKKFHYP